MRRTRRNGAMPHGFTWPLSRVCVFKFWLCETLLCVLCLVEILHDFGIEFGRDTLTTDH